MGRSDGYVGSRVRDLLYNRKENSIVALSVIGSTPLFDVQLTVYLSISMWMLTNDTSESFLPLRRYTLYIFRTPVI